MRRFIATLLPTLALLIVPMAISLSSPVAAVDVFGACSKSTANSANGTDVCNATNKPTSDNPIITIIATAINILSIIIGFAAVVMIIVSGITFVLSGSDPQAVARARSGIIYALAGVVIVAFSQAIVKFVLDKL